MNAVKELALAVLAADMTLKYLSIPLVLWLVKFMV